MANSDYSNPESLDTLTAMVNQTLIETGRFFRSSGSMQSRAQLKRTIPVAHEQFQCALDSLSEQIFIAKAFLEREYDAINANKAALQPAEDIIMEEPVLKQEPEITPQPEKIELGANQAELKPAKDSNPAESLPTANLPQQTSPEHPVKAEKPDEPVTSAPVQPPSGPAELNFDSALKDSNGGANEFDLNLDFGDDDLGNEHFLSGTNIDHTNTELPDYDKGNEQSGPDNLNTNFESGGDAFDLELQKAGTFGADDGAQEGQMGGNADDMMAPGESSFDDLFMDSEHFGDAGVGDASLLEGDGLMNINELDDNWFT